MMNLQDVQNALHRRPFVPFRIFVTDGVSYDIRHPELCVPGLRSVFIGLIVLPETLLPQPVFDRWAMVDLIHITRLEPLEPTATPATGNGAGG